MQLAGEEGLDVLFSSPDRGLDTEALSTLSKYGDEVLKGMLIEMHNCISTDRVLRNTKLFMEAATAQYPPDAPLQHQAEIAQPEILSLSHLWWVGTQFLKHIYLTLYGHIEYPWISLALPRGNPL